MNEAEEQFGKSVGHHSVQAAYVQCGLVMIQLKKFKKAIELLRAGLRENRDQARIIATLGTAYLHRYLEQSRKPTDLVQGLRHLRDANARDYTDPIAARGLAVAALHRPAVGVGRPLPDLTEATARLELALRDRTNRASPNVRGVLAATLSEVLCRRFGDGDRRQTIRQSRRWARRARRWSPAQRPVWTRPRRTTSRAAGREAGLGHQDPDSKPDGWVRRVLAGSLMFLALVTSGAGLLGGFQGGVANGWPYLVGAGVFATMALGAASPTRPLKLPWGSIGPAASQVPTVQLSDPMPLAPVQPVPAGMDSLDLAAHLLAQPRFPRLGPAVGPLVTGYYATREVPRQDSGSTLLAVT